MGATTLGLGVGRATFAAVAFDDIRHPVELTATSARFVQTVGGHTAVPAPRRVNKPPFVKFEAPTVWTTLALTIHADGVSEYELTGASAFPRHWVYDHAGALAAKAGMADFKDWWRHSFGKHTPWGDQDSPALVTAVETALERELAGHIMRGGGKSSIRKLKARCAAHRAGSDRRRRLPPPQRRAERRGRRRADRRGRPRAPSSESGPPSKEAYAPRRCGR